MSELITPEEFIQSTAFIKALKDIDDGLKKVLTTIGTASDTIKKYNDEVKKGADSQKTLTDNQKKANDTSNIAIDIEKEVTKIQEKRYKLVIQQSEAVQKETEKLKTQTKEIRDQEKALKAQTNSLEGLRAKQQILREQRDKLIITDKNYKENLTKLNKEIDKNDAAIRQATDGDEKRKTGIGKYKEAFIEAFTKIAVVVGIAKGAMSIFNKVVENSETLSDRLEVSIGGVKSGLSYLGSQLVKLDFKNLIEGTRLAAEAGREYVTTMDDMQDRRIALGFLEASASTRYTEIMMKLRNINTTENDAKKLSIEAVTMQDELSKKKQEIANTELQALLKKIATERGLIKGNSDAEIEIGKNQVLEWAKMSDDLTKEMTEKANSFAKKSLDKTVTFGETMTNMFPAITSAITVLSNKSAQESVAATDKAGNAAFNLIRNLGQITEDQKKSILAVFQEIEGIRNEEAQKEGKIENRAAKLLDANRKEEVKGEKDVAKEKEEIAKNELDILKKQWKEMGDFYTQNEKDVKDQAKINEQYQEESTKNYLDRKKSEEDADKRTWAKKKALKEKEKESIKEVQQLQLEALNAVSGLYSAVSDNKIATLENEKEKELAAAGDNSKKKERIEAEYAKKIAAIKRKQAIADKAMSVFNISLSTAKGIMDAMSKVVTQPLVPWITLVGALQLATVLAQPIPKFFKGVKNFKGGNAIVGEEGFELGETKEGKMFLTPDKATMMSLPQGANIYTHEKTIEKLNEMNPALANELIKEQRLTRKAFSNQVHNSTIITPEGWIATTEKANSRKVHIDKYFRC